MARKYTQEQRQFFIDFVPGHSYVEIADEFNRRFDGDITPRVVKSYMANHKLRNGNPHKFQKGHVPWSKGKKMSPEQYEKCKRTFFKKGVAPQNKRPIGSENVDCYGYTWVKVSDKPTEDSKSNWRAKQRVVYEQAHGPIPDGYIVLFLDGDKTNFDIDNLYLVNQKEMIALNQKSLRSEEPELTRAGITMTRIINKIKEIEGDNNEVS